MITHSFASLSWKKYHFEILLVVLCIAGAAVRSEPSEAASAFSHPAFQAQWQAGEHLVPNFWGPLLTARDGQQEYYADAPGKQRLVQYFDKGRMELGDPMSDAVTNGLLATELITGKIQVGDNTFEARLPPSIPIAGDLDNPGPTYLTVHSPAAMLLAPAQNAVGAPIVTRVSASGEISTDASSPGGVVAVSIYDTATQHNVAAPFSAYREKVGLLSIGYAKGEPFRATMKVAGTARELIIQVFERRVLTYNPANSDPFKVEMGNIGQHYYQWRPRL